MTITLRATNPVSWTADYEVTALDTAKKYDLIRIMDGVPDNERKYSIVGSRRDWQPSAASVWIRDYQAPLRPYRIALFDSSGQTPVDWLFQIGPYGGPAPVQTSALITPPSPTECGAILRSSVQPERYAQALLTDNGMVVYPARMGEHAVIGAKYPVFVVDRREGRRMDVVLYTNTALESRLMEELLLPETGRIYPLWLRTSDPDGPLTSDYYFMPGEISVEPVTKMRAYQKFWRIRGVELDPRSILPRNFPDGLTQVALPRANADADSYSGKAPLTVHFTDASTGTITDRKWDFAVGSSKYGTSTAQNPSVTYTTKGTFKVRLTVKGPGGADSDEIKIKVT